MNLGQRCEAVAKQNLLMLRWLPLFIIALGLSGFFYFRLYEYLSFQQLKNHKQFMFDWTNAHYKLAIGIYLSLYVLCVAMSIPSNFIFALLGGMLFGFWQGLIFALISATTGSILVFLAIKLAFANWFKQRAIKWVAKMEKGFQENALHYILVLRLIPIFPFWIINIAAALLGVRTTTFALGTFLGIVPLTVVYIALGNNLNQLLDSNQTVGMNLLLQPSIILSLIGLGVLVLLPVLVSAIRKKVTKDFTDE